MQNVLTFDLEHWHSATLVSEHVSEPQDRIVESVASVLELLGDFGLSATFFVVGSVAREHPDLIRRIAKDGHEIASHGDSHTPLGELTRASFAAELERSIHSIERATGTRPRGFRAPNFSLNPATAWAVDELNTAGFTYDASVFPIRTPMYGVSGAPIHPYRIRPEAPFTTQPPASRPAMIELPAAVFHPRFKMPIAGGFYARLLPRQILMRGIRQLNQRGFPATLYFHPWEFNPAVPINRLPWHKEFISFHGIEHLAEKVKPLLSAFNFAPAEAVATRHEAATLHETPTIQS